MRYGHLVVSAFCAWVLWQETLSEPGTVTFHPADGTDTVAECVQAKGKIMAEHLAAYEHSKKVAKVSSDPEIFFMAVYYKDGTTRSTKFRCLPDTIDLRK